MQNLSLPTGQIVYAVIGLAAIYAIYKGGEKAFAALGKHKRVVIGMIMLSVSIISGCGWVGLLNEPGYLGVNKVVLGCSFGAIISLGFSALCVLFVTEQNDQSHRFR